MLGFEIILLHTKNNEDGNCNDDKCQQHRHGYSRICAKAAHKQQQTYAQKYEDYTQSYGF